VSELLAELQIVLLRPSVAGNLGAVARAMKNFGLRRLVLVDAATFDMTEAQRMAVHAEDVLDGAVRSDDLGAVLAGANWLVATTNRPPAGMQVLTPREVAEQARERGAPLLLFGGETSGLELGEIRRCHAASMIPVAAGQSSLNLAQAVCVYAAEWFAAHGRDSAVAVQPRTDPPAPVALLQQLEPALVRALSYSRWGDADRRPDAIGELLQPWLRAGLTEREVRAWLTALGKFVPR
jgi:TrmH family RNA methyltransferase